LKARPFIVTFQAFLLAPLAAGCFSTVPADGQQDAALGKAAATPCLTPEEAERMADQVLQLVNLERAERNLQPVVVDERLTKVAEDYACRMASESFFGHHDPLTGDGPAKRAVAGRYRFYSVGENLAAGPETPADVMKAWMKSPSHRDIILDPTWRDVGIAVRAGGEYSIYWVQEFGDPAEL